MTLVKDKSLCPLCNRRSALADPHMKVELLVSRDTPLCARAEKIWRDVARERDIQLSVVDMDGPEGKALAVRWRLSAVPAILVDDDLVAIGVLSLEQARHLVSDAPPL